MILGSSRAAAFGALASLFVAALTIGTGTPATPRTAIEVHKDIIYSVSEGGALSLDVYHPVEGWGHRSLLVIHGGSWKRGDKSDWRWVARDLARGGFAVFVANYRLAPPNGPATYPTPVDDLRTAWAWMQQNAARYHGDANNIALVGSSAGGHLGLILASEMSGDPMGPRAVVALSPPTDLETMGAEGPLKWAVKGHLGCRLADCPSLYEAASPLTRVQPTDPPTFLAYSTEELIPLSHGEAMRDRLIQAGVETRFVVIEGTAHALRLSDTVIPKAMRFLRRSML
jgi:acetyl esterase